MLLKHLLFRAALDVNGIESQAVEVYTKNGDDILVNNWQFADEPSLTGTEDYRWRLILNDEGTRKDKFGKKEYLFGTYPLNEDHFSAKDFWLFVISQVA